MPRMKMPRRRKKDKTPKSPPPKPVKPTHLVVVQNGLFGQARNVRYLADKIRKELGPLAHVHIAQRNQFRSTTDGVDAGGRRLAVEVLELAGQMDALERFSIVGFSLGGLYARFAVAILGACGFLRGGGSDGSEEARALAGGLAWARTPVIASCYVSIASPHMGSRRSQSTKTGRVLTWIGGRIFSATGAHLMLNDGAIDGGTDEHGNPLFVEPLEGLPSPRVSDGGDRPVLPLPPREGSMTGGTGLGSAEPLLSRMTKGAFLDAMGLFQHRACYGNVKMDRTVPYSTACILPKNPAKVIAGRKFPRVHGYPHVVDVGRAPVPLATPAGDLGDSEEEYGHYESHQEPWRSMLVGMLQRLGGLGWERVPVILPPPHTHGHIVVRVPVVNFSGRDVVRHVARNVRGVAEGHGRPEEVAAAARAEAAAAAAAAGEGGGGGGGSFGEPGLAPE